MSEILQYLQQALDAANAAGDVDTIAAIAALMKKVNATADDAPEPAPMPPTAATTPLEAAPTEAPQPTIGPLYEAAQNALQLYPNHEYLGEDAESVTISVTDDQGVETIWRVPVTVDADGNATLGEPEQIVQEPEEPPSPPPQPVQVRRRALLSLIGPRLLESANTNNEVWVNIVNLGEYEHPEYGTIVFTEEHFRQWKANLERGVMGGRCENGRPCIATDYGHAMDENLPPEMQKASGYIKDLKLEGSRVYALVEFTPRALEGIKNKEWSWFSVSVVDSLLDQRTGQDVGSALLGGALTNRPYIPDLEPIRLTDLRPSRATQLQRELAAREAEIVRLKREKYDAEVKATLAALEQARIPPSVIGLVRLLLEADYEAKPTIKLARGGREQHLTPGKAAIEALMELARVGLVPAGERTGKPTDPGGITLEQAVAEVEAEWQKAGKRNYRRKDLYLAARRKYPHLREN
jgi:hypothetical protein